MTAGKDSDTTDSLDYKVGEKVRSCRLAKGYTQKDLAEKIGVKYWIILQHEKGNRRIPIERLYAIAETLSVSIIDLIPVLNKKSCLEGEEEEILNLVRKYKKINNQELRKIFYLLTRSAQISEESSKKAERMEIAKNLVKAGISVDVVSKTTGLPTNKYTEGSVYYKIGKKIKEWRLIQKYTQEDLAKKIGITRHKISKYEQGETAAPLDKLYKIAEALSINIMDLLPELTEDNEVENELSSLIEEYKKIENQELRDILDALVKFLSEGMQTSKEKIKKAEKIRVAKNLVKVGVTVDIILRITGLTADELDAS